jgi:hypothetical protein
MPYIYLPSIDQSENCPEIHLSIYRSLYQKSIIYILAESSGKIREAVGYSNVTLTL